MARTNLPLRSYGHGIDVGREVIRQIVVCSESELLPPIASSVEAVTEATLVICPAWVGRTTMEIVALAPFPSAPRLQVTIPAACPQVPWLGLAEMNVTVG